MPRNNYIAILLILLCFIMIFINTSGVYNIQRSDSAVEKKPNYFFSEDEFKKLMINDTKLKMGNEISLPKLEADGELWDLKDQYHIMVPLSDIEDIAFFKSFYNDLEVEIVCDKNDKRKSCDRHLSDNYSYYTLNKKTHELFQGYCNSEIKHKIIAKMD
ncbi:hypothetical protein BB560_002489 [Smittium megazygosporum]|uniref:Uncharacterized protein n=1 Tax=Smittium megazygosporum TaxID=133381 RepID=A0A2T9ZET5_9FUNG|nr:hypothetical protein BB560_002489 [Smittium megazygosporum]